MSCSRASFKENTWFDPFKGLEASKAKLKLACPGRTRSAMQMRPKMCFPLNAEVPSSMPRSFKLQPLKALRDVPLSFIKNHGSPIASTKDSPQGTPDFSIDKTKRRLKDMHQVKRIPRPSHSSMRPMRISGRTIIKSHVTRVKSMTSVGDDLLECSFGFTAFKQAQL